MSSKHRRPVVQPVAASLRSRREAGDNVLRFPTRRRRAFPRPAEIVDVHPALLARMASIYLDVSLAHDWEAGQRYVDSLGWDRGLCHVLNPAIRREIEARGGTVEEETG